MVWGEFGAKSLEFIDRPITKDARITILDGAVRSSKTISCMPKFIEYCRRGPSGVIAITGVSKLTIKRNVLNDLFNTIGDENFKYNQTTGELRVFNRDCQVIGIKDEGSEKYIRGGTYAGWFGDEATTIPQSSFTQMLNRMSIEGSKAYLTTNPDSPYHYLFTDYITNDDMLRDGTVRRIHFDLNDNPNLADEYKNFIRGAYSGLWYKRMILGQWVLAEGAIYDMFDDKRHTCGVNDIPDEFARTHLMGVDYGSGNPTVFLLIGVTYRDDGKPIVWILDEFYHDGRNSTQKTTGEYKADMVRFMEKREAEVYPDPSALPFILELKSDSCGRKFTVRHANNDVLAGINTIATFMSDDRYKIVRDRCPNTVKEKASYVWDVNAQKRGEDAPLKEHDHCMDAERYPIHTKFPATTWARGYAVA